MIWSIFLLLDQQTCGLGAGGLVGASSLLVGASGLGGAASGLVGTSSLRAGGIVV